MKDFAGKVAAIIGAGSGMGRSLAPELARCGCLLALSDIDAAGLAETAARCAARGFQVSARRLDVSSRADVFDRAVAARQDSA